LPPADQVAAATSGSPARRTRPRGSPNAGCPALADVGLVGLPNAGKSSLLSRLTRAAPKIANYPFTTLSPVLGTLHDGDRQLVIADIPGLIEGASDGAGLGHDFLAHIERTRLLVHVLDLAPLDGSDPLENHVTVENELALHDPRLASLPRILVLSKADLVEPETAAVAAAEWSARLGEGIPVLVTSSVSRQGLPELVRLLLRSVPLAEAVPTSGEAGVPQATGEIDTPLAEHRVFRPRGESRNYTVSPRAEGGFRVDGPAIERLIARYDLDNEDAMAHLERRLRGIGVIRALENAGFEPGDDVELAGIVFDLDPAGD
jgi:GTP-binding protein